MRRLSERLYLLGWLFFAPLTPAAPVAGVSPENSELVEYEEIPNPLAQLPALGVFCCLKYPGTLNECHIIRHTVYLSKNPWLGLSVSPW